MATVAQNQGAVVKKTPKQQVVVEVDAPSRREFLYYVWGASMVMLLGEGVIAFIWFALPRFKEGEFGGTFPFSGDVIPVVGGAPLQQPAGRFWLSNTERGLVVLYGVCTHLGCLPKWVAINNRFECPCHGSKFELDGTYISGPAPRRLDRFTTTIVFADGTSLSNGGALGAPIPIEGREVVEVRVDTGGRIADASMPASINEA